MPASCDHDPRTLLVRDKYFSLRPKPLERWLWAQGVPAAAERVFWLHWQEGVQRKDWCSEIPLKRVARECCVDPSTVTRAYQLLAKLGCLRRTDPGRDPANPFNQATSVTEVRVPRELLVELDRHPNRRSGALAAPNKTESVPQVVVADATEDRPIDPFLGLGGRDRVRALAQLTSAMSVAEEGRYRDALRAHQPNLEFDADTKLTDEARGRVLQFLRCLAVQPSPRTSRAAASEPVQRQSRKLSVFELARLRRDLRSVAEHDSAPELMRQVVWSIEEGSLQRFGALHGVHIALKKIREGAWTRPNRMPPNWARDVYA